MRCCSRLGPHPVTPEGLDHGFEQWLLSESSIWSFVQRAVCLSACVPCTNTARSPTLALAPPKRRHEPCLPTSIPQQRRPRKRRFATPARKRLVTSTTDA